MKKLNPAVILMAAAPAMACYDEQGGAARDQQNFLVLCNVGGVSSGGASLVMHHCQPMDIDGKPVDPK